jgi:hypothetical protein
LFNRLIDLGKGYRLRLFWNDAFEPSRCNARQNHHTVWMKKELEPVAGLDLKAIPNCFGDRCLAFTAERSFHVARFSFLYILSEVKIG